jgi:hypothetical protein
MTREEFISLVRYPKKLTEKHIFDLKNLTDEYPYFVQARVLYAKALKDSNNIHHGVHAKRATLHTSDRRRLYFYLHPEQNETGEVKQPERSQKTSAGEYFDMIEIIEKKGGDQKQSLKELAERLKAAREIASVEQPPVDRKPKNVEYTEEQAKILIREKKYTEAYEILKALNLNNPKKSAYFADQIRFLEKIIINKKK